MSDSRSILFDLEIDPDNMFSNPEKFQEDCLSNAERLASVMQGKELPGDRICREMLKAAAARTNPETERVKNFLREIQDKLFSEEESNNPQFEWSSFNNEELAQLSVGLKRLAEQVENELSDRLISGGLMVIRSKRLASYLYQRLRVFHDKWRNAQKLMNPDIKWKIIPGMPGNYKDNGTFFIYTWNREEYNYHTYIVHQLKKNEVFAASLDEVKTVADFHEWVADHPECGVNVMEVS